MTRERKMWGAVIASATILLLALMGAIFAAGGLKAQVELNTKSNERLEKKVDEGFLLIWNKLEVIENRINGEKK